MLRFRQLAGEVGDDLRQRLRPGQQRERDRQRAHVADPDPDPRQAAPLLGECHVGKDRVVVDEGGLEREEEANSVKDLDAENPGHRLREACGEAPQSREARVRAVIMPKKKDGGTTETGAQAAPLELKPAPAIAAPRQD